MSEHEIPPALTPDEWASMDHPHTIENAVEIAAATWNYPQAMALANAALPDDSPHKITRADVDFLRDELGGDWWLGDPEDPDAPRMKRILAKLYALLPPE